MKGFIEKLNTSYICQPSEDGIVLHTPIMYTYADHPFSFFIKRSEGNGFIVTDRGQTLDYLRENDDPGKYSEKIAKICEHFHIELIEGEFVGKLSSLESGQTMRNLYKFMGAMNMIANIHIVASL